MSRVTAVLVKVNLRINPPENNSLALTRFRVALLKTLFLLEHLPELVNCTNSHVLGLVLNTFGVLFAARTPHGGHAITPNALPNLFRCQTSLLPPFSVRKPSPEAHETCRNQPRKAGRPVSGSAPLLAMAANQNQRMRICEPKFGGADRDRTGDLMLAKHALSQLSYSPTSKDGGPG